MLMTGRQHVLLATPVILTSLILELALAQDWGPELTGWSVAAVFFIAFFLSLRFPNRQA